MEKDREIAANSSHAEMMRPLNWNVAVNWNLSAIVHQRLFNTHTNARTDTLQWVSGEIILGKSLQWDIIKVNDIIIEMVTVKARHGGRRMAPCWSCIRLEIKSSRIL